MAEETHPTFRIGDEAECREAYAGNIAGIRAETLVDRAHFLSAGAVSFARGLNDAPKIAALMLVAAHPSDLRAARAQGLRIAYVIRPLEFGAGKALPEYAPGEFDLVANDFKDLARQLGA